MQNQSEFKKHRVAEMNIEINAMFLTVDYKDIDLFYYLSLRYNQSIAPALALMSGAPETDVDGENKIDSNRKDKPMKPI